jgi:enoyl-CoA hydratase/carnithine racemase
VAADDAVFWEPFIDRGFSPDSGSTWLLPRLVGLARARRMLLLGEKVSAPDAADWGLIHQTVSGSALDHAAEELLGRLASGPTAAIGLAKQALNFGPGAVQLGIVLPDKRFQGGSGGLRPATGSGISWTLTRDATTPEHRVRVLRAGTASDPSIDPAGQTRRKTKGWPMPTDSFDTIQYEVDGHTATITLNRPDALNALSPHMIAELRAAYDEAENDDQVWLTIVTGTGRAFCTGADVKEIPEDGKVIYERPYLSTYDQWEAPQEGTPPFRTMAKPVLTAVNGICCGAGMDWVTTTDIVIASEQATFFDPHVSIGLVAGRELVRVSRVLPRSIALRMALMGKHERMGAQRAYELGLISEIVEHDRLLERAHEIADIVNSNAPLAVRGTRLAILKGLNVPLHEAEILAETFRERVLRTEDAQEGPRAFVEKRKPNWQCR